MCREPSRPRFKTAGSLCQASRVKCKSQNNQQTVLGSRTLSQCSETVDPSGSSRASMLFASPKILQARIFLTELWQEQEEEEGASFFLANVQAKWEGLEDGSAAAAPHRGPQSHHGKMLQLRSPNHVDFQRNSKGLEPILLRSTESGTHNSLGLGKYSYFYQSAKSAMFFIQQRRQQQNPVNQQPISINRKQFLSRQLHDSPQFSLVRRLGHLLHSSISRTLSR